MEIWNATRFKIQNEENESALYTTFLTGSRFWIQRVLLPLVVAIGVIGNGVTVVVLTRRRMRSSTNTYLTALAISDLLYLIFVFTLSLEHYPGSHTRSFYFYWLYYRFGLWLTDVTTCISTWLTVTFTIERYIAVCHPMKGKILCTESRARTAIFVVCLLCFLSTVTTPMEWELNIWETKTDSGEVTYYVGIKPTLLAIDIHYTTIFYWFWSVSFVFLPLLLLGVFNSFLIFAVHKSRRNRCKMTQKDYATRTQTQENKITVTLIAVVILFVFCQIPTAILLILKSVHNPPDNSNMDKLYRVLGNIFNFLVTINAASNFLLYCAFSSKYRRTLVTTFLGRCYRISTPPLSTMSIPDSSHFVRGGSRSTIRERLSGENSTTSRSLYGAVVNPIATGVCPVGVKPLKGPRCHRCSGTVQSTPQNGITLTSSVGDACSERVKNGAVSSSKRNSDTMKATSVNKTD